MCLAISLCLLVMATGYKYNNLVSEYNELALELEECTPKANKTFKYVTLEYSNIDIRKNTLENCCLESFKVAHLF